jgi:hypothetical protein
MCTSIALAEISSFHEATAPAILSLPDDRLDVREQVLEDRVLALREVERLAREHRALLVEIDGERAVLDDARLQRAAAARERVHAREAAPRWRTASAGSRRRRA